MLALDDFRFLYLLMAGVKLASMVSGVMNTVMYKLYLMILLLLSFTVETGTDQDFETMLKAAQEGDSLSRLVVANAYYYGKYRDGSLVEKDVNKAYAWALLAKAQGDREAGVLVDQLLPELKGFDDAEKLAADYFKRYGAISNSATR